MVVSSSAYAFIEIMEIFENLYFTRYCSDAVNVWWYL